MSINEAKLRAFQREIESIDSDFRGIFRCPICLNDYQYESYLANSHIIPESLGGRSKTIACESCDSVIGANLEGPLANYINNLEVLGLKKRNRKVHGKVSLSYAGKNYKTRILSKDNTLIVNLPVPGDIEALEADMKNTDLVKFTLNCHFNSNKVNNRAAQLIGLKMAYYAAFDQFGYRYILNSGLDWIRDIIRNPEYKNLPYTAAFYSPEDIMSILPDKPEFAIHEFYFEDVCVPVFFINHLMVFLPPFLPKSIDNLKSLYRKTPNRRIKIGFNSRRKTLSLRIDI